MAKQRIWQHRMISSESFRRLYAADNERLSTSWAAWSAKVLMSLAQSPWWGPRQVKFIVIRAPLSLPEGEGRQRGQPDLFAGLSMMQPATGCMPVPISSGAQPYEPFGSCPAIRRVPVVVSDTGGLEVVRCAEPRDIRQPQSLADNTTTKAPVLPRYKRAAARVR